MSVEKSKRSKPKCDAVLKAKKVCEHTIIVASNKNLFTCDALANDIIHQAELVYIHAYNANNVYVKSEESYGERITHQTEAILACKSLIALIDIAWHMFHLKGQKVDFWTKIVLDAKTVISAWSKNDKERYKEFKPK